MHTAGAPAPGPNRPLSLDLAPPRGSEEAVASSGPFDETLASKTLAESLGRSALRLPRSRSGVSLVRSTGARRAPPTSEKGSDEGKPEVGPLGLTRRGHVRVTVRCLRAPTFAGVRCPRTRSGVSLPALTGADGLGPFSLETPPPDARAPDPRLRPGSAGPQGPSRSPAPCAGTGVTPGRSRNGTPVSGLTLVDGPTGKTKVQPTRRRPELAGRVWKSRRRERRLNRPGRDGTTTTEVA